MPENTVYVGRPSKWGNPLPLSLYTRKNSVELFEKYLTEEGKATIRKELKGKNLACWCKVGDACHADVLLKIANS